MTTDAAHYDERGEVPLAGYAVLASAFAAGTGAFALLARQRGVRLPERVPPWDVVLLGTATYKASRLLARDKVTSFVRAPFTRRIGEGEANEVWTSRAAEACGVPSATCCPARSASPHGPPGRWCAPTRPRPG